MPVHKVTIGEDLIDHTNIKDLDNLYKQTSVGIRCIQGQPKGFDINTE